MKHYEARPVGPRRYILGEGPAWDSRTQTLSWVDIKAGALHLLRGARSFELQAGQYLGAAIPAVSGRYVGLMATGVYMLNRYGLDSFVCRPEDMALNHRFNDAKCDPQGRLWGGVMTISTRQPRETGNQYRFTPDGKPVTVFTGMGIPNGMAWTRDGRTMYLNDTPTGTIFAMDYDPEAGTVSNKRPCFRVTGGGGPDGMCIDAEDKLWVACWGGRQVRRFDPATGEVLAVVDVPALAVSSCCFGGSDLKTLFITTSGEPEPDNPLAGCLFSCRVDEVGTDTVLYDDSLIPDAGDERNFFHD